MWTVTAFVPSPARLGSRRAKPRGGRQLRALCLLLAGLAGAALAQDAEELAFARDLLAALQPLSFAKGREHCGLVGRDAAGRLVATAPVQGTATTCDLPWPDEGMVPVATYHTHGTDLPGFFSELPSEADVRGDHAMGLDGWIATPGGRLWFVDGGRMVAWQACAAGCLPVAPGFDAKGAGKVARAYTLDQLIARFGP